MTPDPRERQMEDEIVDLGEWERLEAVAAAMAEWSSDKPWAERHPKNRRHWLLVAEAVMSNHDAIVLPVLAYARARKEGATSDEALAALASGGRQPEGEGQPASFITFEDKPDTNARIYRHEGCKQVLYFGGTRPTAQWMVPLDDCPPPDDEECPECVQVLPCRVYEAAPSVPPAGACGPSQDVDGSPRFGDWLTGVYASEDNPQRHGMYVRTIRRTGRMNAGTFYELTDGRGRFWEYPAESTVSFALESAAPRAGGPIDQSPSVADRPKPIDQEPSTKTERP